MPFDREAWEQELNLLAAYPAAAKRALLDAQSEADLVDLLGVLHGNRQRVWDLIKSGSNELEPGTSGHRYVMEQGQVAKRSYNDSALLRKFQDAFGDSLLNTIQILRGHGVIRLYWSWTALKKTIRLYDIPVTVVQHEISDGDPDADIGEVWDRGSAAFKPIEPNPDHAS